MGPMEVVERGGGKKSNKIFGFDLNASGTAVMSRPVVLIENPAGNAMPTQLSRHEQANRTCAHH